MKKEKIKTIPEHILKKREPSTLIRVIMKNKNPPKEKKGERERENSHFCVGKIWFEWKKWYQIYT